MDTIWDTLRRMQSEIDSLKAGQGTGIAGTDQTIKGSHDRLDTLMGAGASTAYVPPRHVWISPRADGIAGNGTLHNPFDGSTKTKFDAVISALGTDPVRIHLLPGNYVTDRIMMYDQWQIVGAGIGLTTVTYDGAGDVLGVIGSCDSVGANAFTDLYVSDLTVDCGGYNGDTRETTAVYLRGIANLIVERVRATNPSRPDTEGHIIRCSAWSTTAHSYNFAIRDCIVDTCWGPTDQASCSGYLISHGVVGGAPGAYFNHGGVIEHCSMDGGWLGANGINCKNLKISNCYLSGCQEGILIDTGDFYDVVFDNNHIMDVQLYGIIIGSNNADYTFVNCVAQNNYINTGAAGAVGIALTGHTNYTTLRNNVVQGSGTKAVGLLSTANVGVIWENNNIVNGTVDALPIIHSVDTSGNVIVVGTISHGTTRNNKRAIAVKALTDNVATSVATITTTNETGDTDAGTYSVCAHLLIADTNALGTTGSTACKCLTVQFCRAQGNTGTGVNSAVSEVVETASAAINGAERDIGTVTVTLLEVSEYQVAIQVQADHTGSLGEVLVCVMAIDLNWYGFLTAPTIANA